MDQTNIGTTRTLPLWKSAFEELRETAHHGATYPTEWFEERLSLKRDTLRFGVAISKIRRNLEALGFHLGGHGQKGKQFVIVMAASNQNIGANRIRHATDEIRRAITLLSATDMSLLSSDEARRHDAILERAQIRLALMQRSRQIYKHVKATLPKLIEAKGETEIDEG